MSQGGFSLQIPAPELYYELLPAHHVAIHGQRGVKIRGLWYDGPAVDPYRTKPSTRGGQHKGEWVVRSDPRDRRSSYFQDPLTHEWHSLTWTGLPPDGQIPAFSEARVRELGRAAKAAGLKPQSDTELLPLLLELIDIPVEAWPSQMPKKKRKDHAREVLQVRPPWRTGRPATMQPRGAFISTKSKSSRFAKPMGWRDRAHEVASAVDDERRRRQKADDVNWAEERVGLRGKLAYTTSARAWHTPPDGRADNIFVITPVAVLVAVTDGQGDDLGRSRVVVRATGASHRSDR